VRRENSLNLEKLLSSTFVFDASLDVYLFAWTAMFDESTGVQDK